MELAPRREPQKITYQQYEGNSEKIEMYQNDIFFDEQERLKVLNLLMTNVGMETMVKNLSKETRRDLKKNNVFRHLRVQILYVDY